MVTAADRDIGTTVVAGDSPERRTEINEHTIGRVVDELFASRGTSTIIPIGMIPALSAQFAVHSEHLRAHELHAQADRADDVLDQLVDLYIDGIRRGDRAR